MDTKLLADRFSEKAKAAARARDARDAADHKAAGQDQRADEARIKALQEIVIPFFRELAATFPKDGLLYKVERDPRDGRPTSLAFQIGLGRPISIQISGDKVLITRIAGAGPDASGYAIFTYPPEEEPYIATLADLTREKLSKLVELEIDRA